jgi:hypothetical protein
MCAADVYTGLRDWAKAEQYVIENMNHYSLSPYLWYSWCLHTGHGDLAGSVKAMNAYFSDEKRVWDIEELLQLGCFQMSQGKNKEALATFQRRMKASPGPLSALHIAVIEDELHDNSARNAALEQVATLPERETSLGQFAAVLRNTGKVGARPTPDTVKIDAILANSNSADTISICVLTTQYFDDRGNADGAVSYLKRCAGHPGYSLDRMLADSMMLKRTLNPLELDETAAPPSN